jgi:hypothetical protein
VNEGCTTAARLGRHLRDQVREAERGAPSISLTAQVRTALLKEQLRAAAREGDQTAINLLAELDALPVETGFTVSSGSCPGSPCRSVLWRTGCWARPCAGSVSSALA